MEKTPEQIEAEIAALRGLKGNLPEFSSLGEPIHEAIGAQVRVLAAMRPLRVARSYEDDFVFNCAIDAAYWRMGWDKAPASLAADWERLVQ